MLRRPRTGTVVWAVVALLVSVASLVERSRIPVFVYGSSEDDRLYLSHALSLMHRHWLGPFGRLTLAKGASYPVFIAAMHKLRLPLPIGEQLTYLLAAAAVAACLLLLTRSVAVAGAAYVLLAMDPVNFGVVDSLVFRDGWYSSLTVLFLASTFLAVQGATTCRSRRSWLWIAPAGVVAGVSGAAFWLCREEGPWLLPALLVVVVGPPAVELGRGVFRRAGRRPRPRRVLLRAARVLVAAGLVAVCAAVPIVEVARTNLHYYGVGLTNDLTTGQFARAYADWTRVEAGPYRPGIPISAAQRAAVYAVSPAAKVLEPSLENPKNAWLAVTCRVLHICDDLPGAVSVWAFRDAATSAGFFDSGAASQTFFATLDQQIETACDSGALRCTRRLPVSVQSLQHFRLGPFLTSVRGSVAEVMASRYLGPALPPPRTVLPAVHVLYDATIIGMPRTAAAVAAQRVTYTRGAGQLRLLASVYRVLVPVLAVLGLLGLLWSLVRPRRSDLGLVVLTVGFFTAVVSRLAFVGLLDTTQFGTGGDARYQLPTHATLLVAGVTGTVLLVARIRSVRPTRPAAPGGPDDQPVDHGQMAPVS